jgi:hypothetical protein
MDEGRPLRALATFPNVRDVFHRIVDAVLDGAPKRKTAYDCMTV